MPRRAVALIDRDAIENNCRRLRRELARGVELCAVVKGNAYGHGTSLAARSALAGGADRLGVASVGETVALASEFPGVELLTLGALSEVGFKAAVAVDSEVTISGPESLERAAAAARVHGKPARVHIKCDTGMGRYGIQYLAEVKELARRCLDLPEIELAGLWTHFATADMPDDPFFNQQLDRFFEMVEPVRALKPDVVCHAANSAAVLREKRSHFDMVRPGIAVYGLDPCGRDASAQGLKPALTLMSWVAALRRFEGGWSAGYGRTWRAPEGGTWVATLPIGYGDGILRVFSNNGEVLIAGRRYPIVGNVSMDNITVDLGPETEIKPGDEAVLIGAQGEERITAEEIAAKIGTINYEVTTALSARVSRGPA